MRTSAIFAAMTFALAACGTSGGPKLPVNNSGDAGAAEDGTTGGADVADVADVAVADGAAGSDAGAAGQDPNSACGTPTGERPARRSEAAGVFDPTTNKLAMFGGSFAVPENCGFPISTFEPETWVYDATCDAWAQAKGAAPAARTRHIAVLRTAGPSPQMIIYGGRSRAGKSGPYTIHGDLWAFDFKTETWSELATKGKQPTARQNAAVVYAKSLDALIVWGGNISNSGMAYKPVSDIHMFRFKDSTWTAVTAEGKAPSKRLMTADLWDDKRQQLVSFGGLDETGFFNNAKYFKKLWALKFNAGLAKWVQLDAKSNNGPDGRFWAGLVNDEKADRYFLFGGHDDTALGNRNDLWAFTPEDGQWVEVKVGDVYNKPPLGPCKFPPDFTKMDDESPERRYAMVFSAGPDGAWAAAGKTDCGVIDDLFYLDFKTLKWTEKTISTVGNSCIRKGGLTCNDYCF